MFKRVITDYLPSDDTEALFNNEMTWIANIAIGARGYTSESHPELVAARPAMQDGSYRMEIADITIQSDEPIRTIVDVLADRIDNFSARRKRTVGDNHSKMSHAEMKTKLLEQMREHDTNQNMNKMMADAYKKI